jgi:hypothetical protein
MGSLQLGLPRVVQIWASQLAELDPVPVEKLDVLLRVCGGGSANEGKSGFSSTAVGVVCQQEVSWPSNRKGNLISSY